MPFIWNNKEYKLVPDKSAWDKLEFVITRKLQVQFNPEQEISIEFIKNEFEIYGSLEKVEIFHDTFNNTKFVHVTFKENRLAYCALLHIMQQKDNKLVLIRPADAHLQPDNPTDSSTSPFFNLPDDCFLAIFDQCDFHTLAMLSTVCKKLSELLRTRVFTKIPKFNSVATNDTEVGDGLLTVSRLVQCINPSNFHLKIIRDLLTSVEWPAISVDMKSMKTSMSKISIEMDFFKLDWLGQLEKIGKRIESIHLHFTVYDSTSFDQAIIPVWFPAATKLTISGYAPSCEIPDLSKIVSSLPKLKRISLRNGTVKWDHVINYRKAATNLCEVTFENCFFDSDIMKERIVQIAGVIESGGNNPPLCLIFDRIQTKKSQSVTSEVQEKLCKCELCIHHVGILGECTDAKCAIICAGCGLYRHRQAGSITSKMMFDAKEESSYKEVKKALEDATVRKYVRIQIGREPFSD